MYTEQQARQKWCPHVRQAVVVSREPIVASTTNRDSKEHYGADDINCIGSACMAWRWHRSPQDIANEIRKDLSPTGYCGIAGKP